jgi:AraC-like DNA-binding protein
MKPVLEYLPRHVDESFVTRHFDYYFYPTPWHFHPEYELVLVTESTGKRFIGDAISSFKPGNLALIGPYLPHHYRNDQKYFEKNARLRARSIVVHFKEDSFGRQFFELPESEKIRQLLNRSFKGLEISGKTNPIIRKKLFELVEAQAFNRWMLLMEILNILSESKDLRYICNEVITGQNPTETSRMNRIIDFVIKNFHREIALSEAAAIAHMAENSFSRYFSHRTRKSFTGFVNEVRLNHAFRLLAETNKSITEISMDCGFNNLSNFNRQFRKLYNKNPMMVRKLHDSRMGNI